MLAVVQALLSPTWVLQGYPVAHSIHAARKRYLVRFSDLSCNWADAPALLLLALYLNHSFESIACTVGHGCWRPSRLSSCRVLWEAKAKAYRGSSRRRLYGRAVMLLLPPAQAPVPPLGGHGAGS